MLEGAKLLKIKLFFSFESLKIFWMNNKAIIEFGFPRIWRILQISEDVTVEPLFNEPLFNKVVDITNDIPRPGQSYSKMYGIGPRCNEPRYNEFFDITNIIQNLKRKIYLDITNYYVNARQEINAEQINSQQILFYGKETATFQSTAYYFS